MDEERLQGFLKLVSDEGGDVKIDRFPDGKVRVLTVSTKKMKKGYVGANPTVVQVDTTFGLEQSGYKLNAILYRNPSTGRGEVAVLAFMADETAHSYTCAFHSFEYLLRSNPAVIIIDKVYSYFIIWSQYIHQFFSTGY